jgi:two-component system sensor histidine kinase CpxA
VRLGLLALALGISGLVSYGLARTISTPVRRLQSAAHTLSAGNLGARAGPVVAGRRDEIGVLGREFDSMAERLSALIAARQRLLRDISHELRSPLARMEMAIGLARQDPASTPEQIDRIAREAERLDRLIGHILDYARLERVLFRGRGPAVIARKADGGEVLVTITLPARERPVTRGSVSLRRGNLDAERAIAGRRNLMVRKDALDIC